MSAGHEKRTFVGKACNSRAIDGRKTGGAAGVRALGGKCRRAFLLPQLPWCEQRRRGDWS